jgi:hypothetical protein
VGLEFGKKIKLAKQVDLTGLLGIGYDGFDAIEIPQNSNEKGKSISTLNTNAGFMLRWKFTPFKYLALRSQYHLLNYKNDGGTDLYGDAFTFKIQYGFVSNNKMATLYRIFRK